MKRELRQKSLSGLLANAWSRLLMPATLLLAGQLTPAQQPPPVKLAPPLSPEVISAIEQSCNRASVAYENAVRPADSLLASCQYKDLESLLTSLRRNFPAFEADLAVRFGQMYAKQGLWKEAASEYNKNYSNPAGFNQYYELGVSLGASGIYDQTLSQMAYELVISMGQDNSRYDRRVYLPCEGSAESQVVACALAYRYVHDSPVDPLTLKLLRAALQVLPNNAVLNEEFSALLQRAGHLLLARDHLQKAVDGSTGTYHDSLKQALFNLDFYIAHKKI